MYYDRWVQIMTVASVMNPVKCAESSTETSNASIRLNGLQPFNIMQRFTTAVSTELQLEYSEKPS